MFRGSITALVTPFKNEKIDEKAFKGLIEFQIKNGTDAVVPCGTTGESATLSYEEHERVIELAIEFVNGRIPVIAGAGSNSTKETIMLARHAEAAGADAILLIKPYYNKPMQEGLYQHFKTVAEAVDIPLMMYNVPSRTAVDMSAATVARCAQVDNIVGIKEATGDMNRACDVLRRCPKDFAVMSGDDFTALSLVLLGGTGVISVTSNVDPKSMSALMDAALAGDVIKAREIQYRIFPLMGAMFYDTNPVPAKKALELMGKIKSGTPRQPMWHMGEEPLSRMQAVLKDMKMI